MSQPLQVGLFLRSILTAALNFDGSCGMRLENAAYF